MGRLYNFNKITKVSSRKLRQCAATLSFYSMSNLAVLLIAHSSRLTAYFVVTSECVIACTDSAIRFCTPTLRINFAT